MITVPSGSYHGGSRGDDGACCDVLVSDHVNVPVLSRDADGDAFMYTPDPACIKRLLAHITAAPAPPAPAVLPGESAVELGVSSPGFRVVVRVRPPLLKREDPAARCLRVAPFTSGSNGSTTASAGTTAKKPIVADEIVVVAAPLPSAPPTTATGPPKKRVAAPSPASLPSSSGLNDQRFVFENVFAEKTTQQQLYEASIRPMLDGPLVDGADATIFAYGQTGSGKTFTISGSGGSSNSSGIVDATVGIVPRLVFDLFARLQQQQQGDTPLRSDAAAGDATAVTPLASVAVTMSYVEIYDGKITDLLSGAATTQTCTLVEARGGFQVDGATGFTSTSPDELLDAYAIAASRRATAGTKMNDESSRSHAVFTLRLPRPGAASPGRDGPTRARRRPVINVVDLAGSERVKRSGATGARMDEAISINTSLLALARVIRALVSSSTPGAPNAGAPQHIPYRGSVLTKILASSLGGNARTVLVACVAPTADSKDETISTLRFASIATHVKNDIDKEKAAAADASIPASGTISAPQERLLQMNAAKTSATMFDSTSSSLMVKLLGAGAGDGTTAGASSSSGGRGAGRGLKAGAAAAVTRSVGDALSSASAAPCDDVECYGDFTAGVDAPVVLFLHYYGHNSGGGDQFVHWFSPLADAGYRCLAPSFPGHGGTPGKISSKPDADVLGNEPCQFLSRVLHHFGIKKVAIVVGYDWGGGVAVEYAIRHSARVGAVVAWSISHRDETRVAKLKKRYSGKKPARVLFLGQKNSLVHPFPKQQKHAAACGMKAVCVKDDAGAMREVMAFAKRCGGASGGPKAT